jgi:dihydrofolate reductase
MANPVTKKRKIIVNVATSADGFIARPDGDIEWLTRRPPPKGFYGIGEFTRSIDTKVFGRKTYDVSLRLGATFDSKTRNSVFSRQPAPRQCRLASNSSRAVLARSRSACEPFTLLIAQLAYEGDEGPELAYRFERFGRKG